MPRRAGSVSVQGLLSPAALLLFDTAISANWNFLLKTRQSFFLPSPSQKIVRVSTTMTMSAIDADEPADAIVSDIKAHVDKFRQLSAEETQHFFSSLDGKGRQLLVQLLAERAGEPIDSRAGEPIDSIEENNEAFLGRGLSSPPHAGDPQSQKSKSQQLLVMESCRPTTTRSLELRPSPGATFLHMQGRGTVMRFVFLGLGSVIVAMLCANFYSLLQANISQSDLLKLSRPSPIQLPTATLPPTRDTTSPHVLAPAVQTQSEVEAKPAVQVPAKVEPAVQAPPEIPAEVEPAAQAKPKVLAKVEPAARAARAQVSSMKKESRQQQAAQSTEPP
jgi:hypothetical protein